MKVSDERKKIALCICFIMLICPFIKPTGFAECFGWFNKLFQMWKIVALGVIGCFFIYKFRFVDFANSINLGIVGIFVYSLILLFHAVTNRVAVIETFNNILSDVVILFGGMYFMKREDGAIFRRALNIVVSVDLFIHAITTIMGYAGVAFLQKNIHNHYLYLGEENYSGFLLIPLIGVMLYLDSMEERKLYEIKGLVILLLLSFGYLKTGSLSATACLWGILMLAIMVRFFPNFARYVCPDILLVIVALGLVLVLKYNIQDYMEGVFKLLEDWHHGSFYTVAGEGVSDKITLNNRIFVWPAGVEVIKNNNLLFGHGIIGEIEPALFWDYRHAHNIFLDLLINTGIIGTVGYIWFMIYPLRKLRQKPIFVGAGYLIVTIFIFIALSSMDCYPHMQPMFILYMCVYYEIGKVKG